MNGGGVRIGVLVVAYNAQHTLTSVLDRIPAAFRATVDHVLVCDDASRDATHDVGLAYQAASDLPLTVIRHPRNLGYGGNQKRGYEWAIERGLDIVVLLHGDGQYAPEVIEDLVQPLADGSADAVFGSRMMTPGAARSGGMPRYKYFGNRVLTKIQNGLSGLDLTEWHSGYRAYRVDTLADIPFDTYSDGFDFDTEIILGLREAGKAIAEVPIPTYYGDEICYVNGMRYAKDVTVDVLRHRLGRMGFGRGTGSIAYGIKHWPYSSHGVLLDWLGEKGRGRILDVGCSDGQFGALARELGHHVIGVDVVKHEGVGERLDGFVEADLNNGLPEETGTGYDIVIAADVLEHTIEPGELLNDMIERIAAHGSIMVSVPNFGHWYPRARVVAGRFDYDQRGLLDRGHVRFFTRRSFERLIADSSLGIERRAVVGSPIEVLDRGGVSPLGRLASKVAAADRIATRIWPTLFGYQFIYELRPI